MSEFVDDPQAQALEATQVPEWGAALAVSLLEKRVVVGITLEHPNEGSESSRFELYGRIVEAIEGRGLCLACEGQSKGRVFWLPPQPSSFTALPPGHYRLTSTGEIVEDPEFGAQWTIVSDPSSKATV